MRRRQFITLLGGAAAWPPAAWAQQSNTVKRIGFLSTSTENDPRLNSRFAVFEPELQKLGWTSGRNLEIDIRLSPGDDSILRAQAVELVAKAPDVIVCTGTDVAASFKQLTRAIPIVFLNVADPVASGFVASFARPGGNMTGFTSVEYSFAGKWLSLLRDITPGITRVIVLYYPGNTNWTGYLPTIQAAATLLKVAVSTAPVTTVNEIERAIAAFASEPGGGMIQLPGGFLNVNREIITGLAARHRLPAIYPFAYHAESGGLASYGSDARDVYRRAASYVDRILRGAKPADLPVQAPVKFELVINLKAAKAIGIEVPYNVLCSPTG